MDRKYIEEDTGLEVGQCHLIGLSLNKAAEFLIKVKEKFSNAGYEDFILYSHPYDNGTLRIFGKRLETVAEYNKRIKRVASEKRRKQKRLEERVKEEIRLYKNLCRKHGDLNKEKN
jgi:hypothetical protein